MAKLSGKSDSTGCPVHVGDGPNFGDPRDAKSAEVATIAVSARHSGVRIVLSRVAALDGDPSADLASLSLHSHDMRDLARQIVEACDAVELEHKLYTN